METGEGDEVHRELAEVSVELTREAKAAGDTGHDGRDEVVEVTEGRGGELEGAEADVVQRLVVEDHALVSVLDELVHREGSIVRLDNGVRDLGGGARQRR